MVPWKYVTGCRTWTAVQVNSVPLATSASGTDTSYRPRGSCGGDKDNYMMAHQLIMNTREPPHLLRPPRAQQTVVPPPGEGGGRVPAQVGAGQPQLVCCGAPPPGAPPPPHPRPRHQLPVHTDQGGRGAVWGVELNWCCSF